MKVLSSGFRLSNALLIKIKQSLPSTTSFRASLNTQECGGMPTKLLEGGSAFSKWVLGQEYFWSGLQAMQMPFSFLKFLLDDSSGF